MDYINKPYYIEVINNHQVQDESIATNRLITGPYISKFENGRDVRTITVGNDIVSIPTTVNFKGQTQKLIYLSESYNIYLLLDRATSRGAYKGFDLTPFVYLNGLKVPKRFIEYVRLNNGYLLLFISEVYLNKSYVSSSRYYEVLWYRTSMSESIGENIQYKLLDENLSLTLTQKEMGDILTTTSVYGSTDDNDFVEDYNQFLFLIKPLTNPIGVYYMDYDESKISITKNNSKELSSTGFYFDSRVEDEDNETGITYNIDFSNSNLSSGDRVMVVNRLFLFSSKSYDRNSLEYDNINKIYTLKFDDMTNTQLNISKQIIGDKNLVEVYINGQKMIQGEHYDLFYSVAEYDFDNQTEFNYIPKLVIYSEYSIPSSYNIEVLTKPIYFSSNSMKLRFEYDTTSYNYISDLSGTLASNENDFVIDLSYYFNLDKDYLNSYNAIALNGLNTQIFSNGVKLLEGTDYQFPADYNTAIYFLNVYSKDNSEIIGDIEIVISNDEIYSEPIVTTGTIVSQSSPTFTELDFPKNGDNYACSITSYLSGIVNRLRVIDTLSNNYRSIYVDNYNQLRNNLKIYYDYSSPDVEDSLDFNKLNRISLVIPEMPDSVHDALVDVGGNGEEYSLDDSLYSYPDYSLFSEIGSIRSKLTADNDYELITYKRIDGSLYYFSQDRSIIDSQVDRINDTLSDSLLNISQEIYDDNGVTDLPTYTISHADISEDTGVDGILDQLKSSISDYIELNYTNIITNIEKRIDYLESTYNIFTESSIHADKIISDIKNHKYIIIYNNTGLTISDLGYEYKADLNLSGITIDIEQPDGKFTIQKETGLSILDGEYMIIIPEIYYLEDLDKMIANCDLDITTSSDPVIIIGR
jgi:hypothetical protein